MRVQLDRGDKSIDLEQENYSYDADAEFLSLLKDALVAMGYTEEELLAGWREDGV